MPFPFYLLIAAVVILVSSICVYFYFYIKRSAEFFGAKTEKRGVRIICAVCAAAMCVCCVNVFSISVVIVLYLALIACVVELINMLLKLIKLRCAVWDKVFRSGLLPVFLTCVVLFLGWLNIMSVRPVFYTVETRKPLPEGGLRVVFISDLHAGNALKEDDLEEICTEINELKPDLLLFGGDMTDERTTLEELVTSFTSFGSIKPRLGAYYVYGNHDNASYSSSPGFTAAQLAETIAANGIVALRDETVHIGGISLSGRRDAGYSSSQRQSCGQLLDGISEITFRLVLDHQPTDFKACSEAGTDLLLCGHTHGGQIWPIGIINSIFGMSDLVYGRLDDGGFTAIVTSGISGWGYPIRTEHHSEYAVIDIVRAG